jgi:L-ascorbate metabolism protein UlaG (beta-lactamase superfamily)
MAAFLPPSDTPSVTYRGTAYAIPNGNPEWFTDTGLPKSTLLNKQWIIPWDKGACDKGASEGFKWMYERLTKRRHPACPAEEVAEMLPRGVYDAAASPSITWVSHATCLVKLTGVTVLTDPVFAPRCSPSQYLGPIRYTEPGMAIADLPDIDVCVISHDHYDHLCVDSLAKMYALQPRIQYCVPMGTKSVLTGVGIPGDKVMEMGWWDELTHGDGDAAAKVVCTPAQHWCCRKPWDKNRRLWASWVVVSGSNERFFFGGDTGKPQNFPVFKIIGDELGPFDISAIPIGACK